MQIIYIYIYIYIDIIIYINNNNILYNNGLYNNVFYGINLKIIGDYHFCNHETCTPNEKHTTCISKSGS
mgnify:CR=1 FL=1